MTKLKTNLSLFNQTSDFCFQKKFKKVNAMQSIMKYVLEHHLNELCVLISAFTTLLHNSFTMSKLDFIHII